MKPKGHEKALFYRAPIRGVKQHSVKTGGEVCNMSTPYKSSDQKEHVTGKQLVPFKF